MTNYRPTIMRRIPQGVGFVLLSTVLLLSNDDLCSHALSSSSIKSLDRKPIRRVAIIGSGIAGLATAHALVSTTTTSNTQQNSIDVSVYDARKGLDRGVGAGIQLNGALSVLGRINPEVQQAVRDAGQTLEAVRSRAKPWDPAKRAEGGYSTLLELPLREVISKFGGEAKAALLPDGELMWISIMRGALQEALHDTLPKETKSRIEFGKLLTNVRPTAVGDEGGSEGGGVICEFSDGSRAGPFDIVVGCDGIKSAVKEYVDTGKISEDPLKREGAAAGVYTGLRIRYAVRDGDSSSSKSEEDPVITQYFGDSAYCFSGVFGAGKDRPNTKCAFITFLDEDYFGPFQKKKPKQVAEENADWTQDVTTSIEVSREKMLRQVRECHVPDGELRPTIENADRFFELGIYAHNPFCRWSREVPDSDGAFVVLAGDAAHALPPFLGQGANQAIQDAYSLGTRIRNYNDQAFRTDGESLESFLRDYEKTRWPAAFQIFWKGTFSLCCAD